MLYSDRARAFRSWHVATLTQTTPLWSEPPLAGDMVEPRLLKFGDHFKLRIERDAVSVAAEWDWEVWDVLFSAQARVTAHDGFYACEHEPDARSAPIERLWEEWLYQPLMSWAESALRQAAVLYFCKRGDTRWVVLAPEVMRVPQDVVYAVYEQ